MIPAMPAVTASRTRQASHAVLRFGLVAAMGVVTALILIAGVWASWDAAPYVMLTKGREHGTVTVTDCSEDTCTGPYTPVSTGSTPRERVVIARTAAVREGQTYTVIVKPGTDEVLRSGPAGILHAWAPLGGALLLASVVVAGGLRRPRVAWVLAGAGVALLTAVSLTA
ncbi:hypothetical protein ACFQWA_11320 [Streptomyces thermogriseus]|uniref:Integral membrane protein n=1 Tax=Streptomyces thermogriseus TaxID=75292 RepID=A0ABN1SXQ9_9ACTN